MLMQCEINVFKSRFYLAVLKLIFDLNMQGTWLEPLVLK